MALSKTIDYNENSTALWFEYYGSFLNFRCFIIID